MEQLSKEEIWEALKKDHRFDPDNYQVYVNGVLQHRGEYQWIGNGTIRISPTPSENDSIIIMDTRDGSFERK